MLLVITSNDNDTGTINATGNITSDITTGNINATGNINNNDITTGGSINASGTINATNNITSNNIVQGIILDLIKFNYLV